MGAPTEETRYSIRVQIIYNVKVRNIQEILFSRKDISPFLVHLTRDYQTKSAKNNLHSMLNSKRIVPGEFIGGSLEKIAFGTEEHPTKSRLAKKYVSSNVDEKTRNWELIEPTLRCICMTETPLDQIHCMLDIEGRSVELKPYGVILLKDKIREQPWVNPVWYGNTYHDIDVLKKLIETMWRASSLPQPDDSKNDKYTAKDYDCQTLLKFLCFIEPFGKAFDGRPTPIDFYWEREWRSVGEVPLSWGNDGPDNVFMGICPHDEIETFEIKYSPLSFIDPCRSPSYYAKKLLLRKKGLGLQYNLL